jgi:hypothetical protein
MFELNLASLPNHVLYLEGVQLSYIKVYVHIFNLWQSSKPCFISNSEFAKRTGLHRDTVVNAIQFFERNNVLKRVQKGNKRYLVQVMPDIETEDSVDNLPKNSANNDHPSELDQGGVGVRPPHQSELDHHNNKLNTKYKKSSCASHENQKPKTVDNQKFENEKRHAYADKKNEVHCTAKFWGPGHPDYDRINSDKKSA